MAWLVEILLLRTIVISFDLHYLCIRFYQQQQHQHRLKAKKIFLLFAVYWHLLQTKSIFHCCAGVRWCVRKCYYYFSAVNCNKGRTKESSKSSMDKDKKQNYALSATFFKKTGWYSVLEFYLIFFIWKKISLPSHFYVII